MKDLEGKSLFTRAEHAIVIPQPAFSVECQSKGCIVVIFRSDTHRIPLVITIIRTHFWMWTVAFVFDLISVAWVSATICKFHEAFVGEWPKVHRVHFTHPTNAHRFKYCGIAIYGAISAFAIVFVTKYISYIGRGDT